MHLNSVPFFLLLGFPPKQSDMTQPVSRQQQSASCWQDLVKRTTGSTTEHGAQLQSKCQQKVRWPNLTSRAAQSPSCHSPWESGSGPSYGLALYTQNKCAKTSSRHRHHSHMIFFHFFYQPSPSPLVQRIYPVSCPSAYPTPHYYTEHMYDKFCSTCCRCWFLPRWAQW